MLIEVKNKEVLESIMIHPFDPKLIEIIKWIIVDNEKIMATEGFRLQKHKNDLHGLIPVRAMDIRSFHYDDPVDVAKRINHYWEYDYNRPNMKVCVYHEVGAGGRHLHIQVHKRTRKRPKNAC